MFDYDLTLDAVIDENLWQAARDGLDDDAVADLHHRDGVLCGGLPEHVGFEREVATDGSFSCRRFLCAAAALWTLSVGDVLGRQQAAGQKTRTSRFDSPSRRSGWRPTAIESDANRHTTPRNHD